MMVGVRARAAERETLLLGILTDRAAANRPCPTNGDLCDLLGMESVGATSGMVTRLEKRGLIRVQRGSTARVVTIIKTGQRTAGEVSAPHWRQLRAPKPSIRRAKSEVRTGEADPQEMVRVNRDPCPRCGVRGDIGCNHAPIERLVA